MYKNKRINSLFLSLITLLLSSIQPLYADQCAYINQTEVRNALDFIKPNTQYIEFCEPCNDNDFYQKKTKTVKNLHINVVDDQQWEIQVNGKGIDLAYTYVKYGKDTFINLSKLATCPSQGVSISFAVNASNVPQAVGKYIPSVKPQYQNYCNKRFGFCVDYPKGFKKLLPAKGEGITLAKHNPHVDNKAFQITTFANIYRNPEIINHSIEETMDIASDLIEEVSYRNITGNSFTLSGYNNNGKTIIYRKTYVATNNIDSHTLVISYPRTDKKLYEEVVNHIVASFRAGDLK